METENITPNRNRKFKDLLSRKILIYITFLYLHSLIIIFYKITKKLKKIIKGWNIS